MKDVTIVGAGPAGCFVGEKLATRGYDVKIIEEDPEIGNPMCCAGILGTQGLKEIGLDPREWALNRLEAGTFFSHSGDSAKISRGETEAYVIDRVKFDKDLAKKALKAGVEIELNTRCVGVSRKKEQIKLDIGKGKDQKEIETRLVIGADGTNSMVARSFDMIKQFSPTICAQAEIVSEKAKNNHKTEVYLGNNLSKNFFAWITPADDFFRVGLGDTSGNVVERLRKFVKDREILPENAWNKAVRFTTGPIPRSNSRKIFGDRVLLVGDAAGHVKPLTGGGIYLGLSCAKIAAETAAEALKDGPSAENLEKYRKRVEEKFDREFQLGSKVRNIYQKMSDDDISEFIELLNESKIRKLILENADFDHHSKLFKAAFEKSPKLLKSLGIRKTAKYLDWFLES